VRPSDDIFMPSDIAALLARRGYDFAELAGSHDDCWVEPWPYIDLTV
jgi:hypothetical protein